MFRENQVVLTPLVSLILKLFLMIIVFQIVLSVCSTASADEVEKKHSPLCVDHPDCKSSFSHFKVVEGNEPICYAYKGFINNVKEKWFGDNNNLFERRATVEDWILENKIDLTYGISPAGKLTKNGSDTKYELYRDLDGDHLEDHIIAEYGDRPEHQESDIYISMMIRKIKLTFQKPEKYLIPFMGMMLLAQLLVR